MKTRRMKMAILSLNRMSIWHLFWIMLFLLLPGSGVIGRETAADSQKKISITPYDPAVKRRIVFTSWYLVRAGWFTWEDEKGAVPDIDADADPGALRLNPNNSAGGIRLMVQKAEEKTLELPEGVSFGTILYDEGKYKAWGSGGMFAGFSGMACFESSDGYQWTCVISSPDVRFQSGGHKHVFLDPSAPAEELYKMEIDHYPKGIGGAVSADGIHWKEFPELILEDEADSHNTGYYDERLKKYVIYHRERRGKTDTEFAPRWQRRAIGRSESTDFRKFPPSEIVLDGHDPQLPPNVDLYMNCRTTIPGSPELQLMFPNVYHRDTDTTSVYLAGSVDGKFWSYVPGGTVMQTATYGQPDGGCIFSYPNLIELPDGGFALHYVGYNIPHKYPRGQVKRADYYAIWPKGRIIALEAETKGRFGMMPIPMRGKKLRINAVTMRSGYIKLELMQNLEKEMLTEPPAIEGYSMSDCDPIVGDQYQKVITWKGKAEIGLKEGEPLLMRFEMDHAKLFSLELVE